MMRLLALSALLLTSACTPQAAEQRCDMQSTREVAFSSPEAADTIDTQAIGPACDKAIGLYIIRDADGAPIWSWSAPLNHAFGAVFAAEDREQMQSFLDTWAQPRIAVTSSAPAWSDLAAEQTSLDELTYEDIRARDLPMLCHFAGTARELCVFFEPAAGGAGHFIDRTVEDTEP